MKETEDIVYRCKDCSKYNLCRYYYRRKETSQICHYFELTERKTGKNVGTDYDEVDQFVCSECGIELQDWHSVERCEDGEVIFHEYTFRYCPHCGTKIEVDE